MHCRPGMKVVLGAGLGVGAFLLTAAIALATVE
jgi:hypothetical protein